MKTMKWLVRREVWEHKGMLAWAPLAVAALMLVFVLVAAIKGHGATLQFNDVQIEPDMTVQLGARQQQAMTDTIATVFPVGAIPLYATLGFIVFFYSLGALYDERRDRSILFWKSLPVSDTATVLSKALLALVGIPLFIVAVELATSLVMLAIMLVLLATKGVYLFGPVLTHPQFWLGPLKVLSLLPVYALWALPAVGWLLLVSAWARSKPFLWAVGVPLLTMALLAWAEKGLRLGIDSGWLVQKFIGRLLISVAPGTWLMADNVIHRARDLDIAANVRGPVAASDLIFQSSWAAVATPETIIGALAGIGMIAAAIWLRRRREET
ncbi:ABC-2 type transport system permease protein [Pseudoduganella flava]|uniref:ABC-2 type transport system permease protein n=1 Tax=Pseudoduganella flava TaxID=871742 RepID=A0A562PK54_9BURK|nr:hypothetical protein [Pseudoduganella flava]QGZ42295.1 hypothetical protein GO485_26820 [Pseudoduganella flava]TWI44842.1 ABC-2 type transport system permease protein [Pseudoduganella flava]